jgi:hypothetical protein
MPFSALRAFFWLSFGESWGLGAVLLLLPAQLESIVGRSAVRTRSFMLVVYAPGLAGRGPGKGCRSARPGAARV